MSVPAVGLSLGLCDLVAGTRWSMTDRGLSARVRPTWVGTRQYTTTDGKTITVLRREAQVNSAGHLETYKRMVGTRNHPQLAGRRVFLSADALPGSPAPWDPAVQLEPHSKFFIGNIGDAIDLVDVPRLGKVPEFCATITDAQTIKDIRSGAVEVSAGYVSWFIPADEVPVDGVEIVAVGQFKNPATGQIEKFDLEGLCDPTDSRIPDEMRPFIGGNHLAFALPRGGGRGGPDVKMLLDAAGSLIDTVPIRRNVRAWQLQRNTDESGVSGPGCVAMVLDVENGPAAAVWLTETASATAYDSLETFKAIHIGNHAAGANELLPLVIGQAFVTPSEQQQELAPPAGALENSNMADPVPDPNKLNTPAPDPNKPVATPDAPPPGPAAGGGAAPDYKAMYESTLKALETLKVEHAAVLLKLKEAEGKAMTAETDKGTAEAKTDALLEELRPHRERTLTDARDAAIKILSADADLTEKIGKATVDELPALVVTSYYAARPDAAALVDDLEGKLKRPEYVRARFDVLREQAASTSPRSAAVSDGFASSFRVPNKTPDKTKLTGQAALDALQNEGAQ